MELPQAHKLLQESIDLLRASKFQVRECNEAATRTVVAADNRSVMLKIKHHPDSAQDWCVMVFEHDEAVKMFCASSNAADVASFVSDVLITASRPG